MVFIQSITPPPTFLWVNVAFWVNVVADRYDRIEFTELNCPEEIWSYILITLESST